MKITIEQLHEYLNRVHDTVLSQGYGEETLSAFDVVFADMYHEIKELEEEATGNTCMNCKYWSNSYKITDGISDCGRIGIDDPKSFRQERTKEGAYIKADAADDTNLSAILVTRATFSCSDHQAK